MPHIQPDCGVKNWIDEPYCVSENLFWNWEFFRCINPGTVESECKKFMEYELIEECGNNYCDGYGENYCVVQNNTHSYQGTGDHFLKTCFKEADRQFFKSY